MSHHDTTSTVLVDAAWAQAHLDDPAVRFVEVDVDTTSYEQSHLPGAVAWNWTSQLSDGVRRDIATREDFSTLLGRARKTLNELEQRAHLSRSDSDLLYRIARTIVYAVSVFGETDYAVRWLKDPNEALGGAVPLKLLATVEGDEIVRNELGAVEHGLPV